MQQAEACECKDVARHVVGVRRVPARVASATFGRFWGFGVGVGGGMIPCFWTSASPKRPSSTLSPSKPEALTPKTPNLESFSIPRIRSQSRHGDARLALALSLLLCLRSADFMPAAGMLRSFADLNPQHNLGSVLHFGTLLRTRRGCEHARRRKGHFP